MRKKIAALVAVALLNLISAQPSEASIQGLQNKTSLSTAKSLIRTLIYNYSQNCSNSFDQCVTFTLANNYPGYTIKSKSLACSKMYEILSISATVDLSSIAPDNSWKLMPPYYQDENPALRGVKPKGDTFIATITLAQTYYDGTTRTQSVDRHYTILNKRAYFYGHFCVS